MTVRPIQLFPDPILKIPCQTVFTISEEIHRLIQDLWDTLESSPGVGLAAPQIGESFRVAVIHVGRLRKQTERLQHSTNHGKIVLINPSLITGSGEQFPREGCLSVPEFLADVKRFQRVKVKTLNLNAHERIVEASGFEALALQHEIDHLHGLLFLDRVANLKTDLRRRKL